MSLKVLFIALKLGLFNPIQADLINGDDIFINYNPVILGVKIIADTINYDPILINFEPVIIGP